MSTTNIPMLDRARAAPQGASHTSDEHGGSLVHLGAADRWYPQTTMSVSYNFTVSENQRAEETQSQTPLSWGVDED